jgi:stage V sporulation protein AD
LAANQVGRQTITFGILPRLVSMHTIVGTLEGKGPYGGYFHEVLEDDLLGQKTAEKAERQILENAVNEALRKGGLVPQDVQYYISGDLLNQVISAVFSARSLGVPFLGIFSACGTFAQGLGLASIMLQGGFADKVMVATSSHYQTAERQYRYPIELNIQHVPTNQHTVTGAGACVLATEGEGPKITHATFGKVVDMGLKNPNDMGSAMAPAAFATLEQHVQDTGRPPDYYDLILTGDLGRQGLKMLHVIAEKKGFALGSNLQDGGALIYGNDPKVGAGASGAACSAVMTLGFVATQLYQGKLQKVLLIGTGALLNQLTVQQGDSIPTVAHAVAIEA